MMAAGRGRAGAHVAARVRELARAGATLLLQKAGPQFAVVVGDGAIKEAAPAGGINVAIAAMRDAS